MQSETWVTQQGTSLCRKRLNALAVGLNILLPTVAYAIVFGVDVSICLNAWLSICFRVQVEPGGMVT